MRHCFYFVLVFLGACQTTTKISSIEVNSSRVNAYELKGDAELDSFISPYRLKMAKKMNDTIAYAKKRISKNYVESELGNWAADAMQWYIRSTLDEETDIAICNYGGLRIKSLPEGPILLSHLYQLMPFENELVVIDIDSNELKTMMGIIIEKGGWPISKGFYMKFSQDNKIIDWNVHGTKTNQYSILISDYLANGGDGMKFLIQKARRPLTYLLRDAFVAYAKHQKNLHANIDGRIIIDKHAGK